MLVIDLDPQTNATVCLIPELEWKARDESGQTLYQLFVDQVKGSRQFNADTAIVRDVSNVGGGVGGARFASLQPGADQDSGPRHPVD